MAAARITTSVSRPRTATLALALPAITVMVAVLYALGAYFLLFRPQLSSLLAGGSLDLSPYRQRVDDDNAYMAKLEAARASYAALNAAERERVSAMTPLDQNVPDIFVQTDAIATRNGLVLTAIDAVPDDKAQTPGGRKIIRVAAGVSGGSYVQFKAFLSDMERALRISDVQSVTFATAGTSYGLVFRTYFLDRRYVGQPPVEPPVPGAAPVTAQ